MPRTGLRSLKVYSAIRRATILRDEFTVHANVDGESATIADTMRLALCLCFVDFGYDRTAMDKKR